MIKHAEILLNVARLSILGAVAAKPDCDANHIINTTGISPSKVYRDLKTLTYTDLVLCNLRDLKYGSSKD